MNAGAEGLVEYLILDFEVHEAEWLEQIDQRLINVMPNNLVKHMTLLDN